MKGVKLDIPQNLEIPPESWIMPVENPIFANSHSFFLISVPIMTGIAVLMIHMRMTVHMMLGVLLGAMLLNSQIAQEPRMPTSMIGALGLMVTSR